MTTARLGNLVKIRSGYTFRARVDSKPGTGLHLLQISDMAQGSYIAANSLSEFQWSDPGALPTLDHDDVALAARGASASACIVLGSERVVASNQFHILSPKTTRLIPGYLCWILNYERYQQHLLEGTSIKAISKKSLEGLKIPLPPIDIQETIVKIHRHSIDQTRVLDQLKLNTKKLSHAAILKMLDDAND